MYETCLPLCAWHSSSNLVSAHFWHLHPRRYRGVGAEDSDEQRTDSCGLALTIRGIIQCVGFIDRSIPKIVDALQCEYRSDHLENIYEWNRCRSICLSFLWVCLHNVKDIGFIVKLYESPLSCTLSAL